jgi:hypothetical protein
MTTVERCSFENDHAALEVIGEGSVSEVSVRNSISASANFNGIISVADSIFADGQAGGVGLNYQVAMENVQIVDHGGLGLRTTSGDLDRGSLITSTP